MGRGRTGHSSGTDRIALEVGPVTADFAPWFSDGRIVDSTGN